ncbi:MAG: hypothetical protein LBI05_08835 [Planctomycetaceae bacterium]|jgi:type II secretory pathway component PulJ|nr:hypothetical protein [Planctomycetaceae bacterium]
MRSLSHPAYTLVELLIALALSLLLLLAVAEMFQRVGGMMNETRSGMSASAHLAETALLLRQDLARIPATLATKPLRIANGDKPEDSDGYLEIIEGPDTALTHPYVNENGNHDQTVGDVDDIIAFTAIDRNLKFRGLVQNDEGKLRIDERNAAEIVWFVRGNTLYRRIRLLADDEHDSGNTLKEVARRENRVIHKFHPPQTGKAAFIASSPVNQYPYPLYDLDPACKGWRYLRMPIMEEIQSVGWHTGEPSRQWKTIPINITGLNEHPDMWENPQFISANFIDRKSGALKQYVDTPRNPRAGEDVMLTNVLSFDVKVWDPTSTPKEFVDLGMQGWTGGNQPALPNTWDSWTKEYEDDGETPSEPPYEKELEAIQITIRCFDPASRVIKQVTVVHRFKD